MSRTKVVEKSNFRIIEKNLLRLYNKHLYRLSVKLELGVRLTSYTAKHNTFAI